MRLARFAASAVAVWSLVGCDATMDVSLSDEGDAGWHDGIDGIADVTGVDGGEEADVGDGDDADRTDAGPSDAVGGADTPVGDGGPDGADADSGGVDADALSDVSDAADTDAGEGSAHEHPDDEEELPTGEESLAIATMTVSEALWASCSTTIVSGLTQQLIDELECLRPGLMASVADDPNIALGPAASPYLQAPAAAALRAAAAAGGGDMYITSGLRSLAQQYLLYQWQGRACGISVAAAPGLSNHNGGLAVDIDPWSPWISTMAAHGWQWLGGWDPVHFDYVDGGIDLRSLSVEAFQRLWNRNNPDDLIAVDGDYGPQTEARLAASPAVGFATGACGRVGGGTGEPASVRWLSPGPNADNPVTFRVETTGDVAEVVYVVDELWEVARSSDRASGFGVDYTFNVLGERQVRATARSDDGVDLASSTIRVNVGGSYVAFDFGPDAVTNPQRFRVSSSPDITRVAYLADGRWPIGESTDRSTHFAVDYTFSLPGERRLEAIGYGAGGAVLARDEMVAHVPAIVTDSGDTDGFGAWLWYAEGTGLTHAQLADRLASLGVARVYIKVADGGASCSEWPELCDATVPQTYRSRGIEPWAWAYNYPGSDEAQADALEEAVYSGYAGFVLDIEVEFDGATTALHNLLGAFTRRRAALVATGDLAAPGAFPIWATTWGNPADHGMRVDIIDQYVDAHMPQTYVEVWGASYMADAAAWVCAGTEEYRRLGAEKPIHHIVSTEYGTITPSQLQAFLDAAGAGASVWRIPGGGTPLSIWDDWEAIDWDGAGPGTCE